MPNNKVLKNLSDQIERDISDEVGNQHEDELETISSTFSNAMDAALKEFNSSIFDDDGFIKKMRSLDIDGNKDKEMMKNVLNNIKSDYVGVESINQSELLVRRDISNICIQMPEMRDVINVIRDGIIECNVATGQVSRDLIFENLDDSTTALSFVKDIEKNHNLLHAIKNFIVPLALEHGEKYAHVVPYAKLFAELEVAKQRKGIASKATKEFKESIPNTIMSEFKNPVSLCNEENVQLLMESVDNGTKLDAATDYKATVDSTAANIKNNDVINKDGISSILEHIEVYNGSSELYAEMGVEGFEKFLIQEYKNSVYYHGENANDNHYMESLGYKHNMSSNTIFDNVDQDGIDFSDYKNIKGCYVKYLDSLKMTPIRMDRKIVGYFYISTTSNEQMNPGNPNGMIDLSYQNYTRDKNLIDSLSSIIIKSFDKRMLEKNIKLKSEIAEILMAHKFSEGRLSFIYIPENEVVRFAVNEDENGRGHSVIEPSIFPARNYLMLSMYNLLYTLNNTTTRIYYLKSSGLNKNYASQVQRKMRKFQSRRITVDDIYSYSGVLNKVGGVGQMVLPAGRGDYKAFDIDTIQAVENPIDLEFLESQRKLAISGTGVPHLMMINAIDEADFAKSLEMANSRFLSTVSSYKIDFNEALTKFYQKLLKYSTDLDDDIITKFRFKFNQVKQQELVITADMITNFNSLVELVESIYYKKSDLEDEQGNSTPKRMILRKSLAREYLPQLDFDRLDELVKEVDLMATDDNLQDKVNKNVIKGEDLNEIKINEPKS